MKRREFCKKAVAGVGGLAGAGRASAGPARSSRATTATGAFDGVVSTRGHYEVTWYDSVRLTAGHGPRDYEFEHAVPGFDDGSSPDEVVVFAHGWEVNGWIADINFEFVGAALDAEGYDHPVVGYKWDADTDLLDWWEAIEVARRNGKKLGAFLADYRDRNPDATIRLMGHSLGGQVVLSTVYQLDRRGRDDVLDSLTMLGAAVHDEVVATDERYGGPVARSVGRADNFHSADDAVLQVAYEAAEFDEALGTNGAQGATPGNYRDHDVDYVETHLSYFFEDGGCFHEVVGAWDGSGEAAAARRRTDELSGTGDAAVHRIRPPDAEGAVVELDGPDDTDFDLYVTLDGREPSTDDFDERSTGRGSEERLPVPVRPDQALTVLVSSYSGGGSYELTVRPR